MERIPPPLTKRDGGVSPDTHLFPILYLLFLGEQKSGETGVLVFFSRVRSVEKIIETGDTYGKESFFISLLRTKDDLGT